MPEPERSPGQVNHCDWVGPGCGGEFRLTNSYDFVGRLRRADWEVDWLKGGWALPRLPRG